MVLLVKLFDFYINKVAMFHFFASFFCYDKMDGGSLYSSHILYLGPKLTIHGRARSFIFSNEAAKVKYELWNSVIRSHLNCLMTSMDMSLILYLHVLSCFAFLSKRGT
jgi:hypothetical protein